ncbi:MAG: leucine-rich repeat domain-containing protein [Clostridia bacterium]|nr:leucine-rich repeat domain-containing protein [Clostridia bacterium]
MKKKILLALLLVAIFTCLFAVAVSANDEFQSIEFKVMLEGETEYTTVYTVSSTDYWNPGISMANKFYADVERTVEFDKSNIVKIDLRNTVVHSLDESKSPVKTKYITRLSGDGNNPYTKVTHFYMPAKVSAIPNDMFKNWTSLEFVDFAEATQIHDNAFVGCTFTEITIPAQITSFRNSVFKDCVNLQSATILGDGATFGSSIFEGCTSLTSVTLTNPTTISTSMFKNCSSMTSYTIPETVTKIGALAFVGTSITSIHFPANVTEIGYEMANGVTTLKTITFAENSQLTFIDHIAFYGSGLTGDIVIPEGVTEIDYNAFAKTAITSVKLPSTLITIRSSVFHTCTALTQIHIPASVTYIGSDCWTNCSSLTEVTFDPACQVTHIYANTFSGTKITEITLPNTVTSIAQGAFGASTLTTVNLGASFNNFDAGNAGQPPLSGRNIKYLYLSDTFTAEKLRNNIFNWTDTNNANDLKVISPHLVVFYSGNKVAAEAIINKAKTGGTDGAMLNGFFASMTLLTQAEYEKAVEDGTLVIGTSSAPARYMVYGYNKCEAFYKGEHNKSEVESKFLGQDYVTDFVNASTCTRCALSFIVGEPICGPLFDDLGYSTEDEGTAFAYAIIVNSTNIDKYIEVTGDTLVYGFIVGLYAENSTGDIINANGEAQIANSLVFDFTEPRYDNLNRFELKFTNITNTELGLYCNAYVINDTDVSYIGAVTEDYKAAPITFANLPKKDEE